MSSRLYLENNVVWYCLCQMRKKSPQYMWCCITHSLYVCICACCTPFHNIRSNCPRCSYKTQNSSMPTNLNKNSNLEKEFYKEWWKYTTHMNRANRSNSTWEWLLKTSCRSICKDSLTKWSFSKSMGCKVFKPSSEVIGNWITGPLTSSMSNGTPNAGSGVSMSEKIITPSGWNASQGCKEISTIRSVVSDLCRKDGYFSASFL